MSFIVNNQDSNVVGWCLKPLALLLCSFGEDMLVDSDAFFLRNPELLFDRKDYRKTGALFFRDRSVTPIVSKGRK
jgi:alpha 1,3-mannosyltransferase